ncbi:hypothetical protein SAICODRAFT_21312 [Saitoella complicata NRRL Y-17804]|uniref:uncharacterized protein n=1 Tax=Saitoella complicata (strain BCRC 22490 / CBS 7301 / JCM 7358 / NBRC 10748 / NRRL Y-17804) TaxID=698492 RepID=UPI000867B9A9|nr:uncharacterized protein SAICODRAFT_21312 [Saitoella complicata NRRL Y-17804]ODQ50642.1 hypothetical protein SAICODRAFT_21312 [Saitoella complicata NRRL Y-17804]
MSKSKANLKGKFQTRTTHTTFGANSSHHPPSLRYTCIHCRLSKPTSQFSLTQLQKHENSGQGMHCKGCTPKQVTSLSCVVCGRRMGLERFAKSQRKNVGGMECRCLECVAKHHEDPEDLFDDSDDGAGAGCGYSDGEEVFEDEPWMTAARAGSPRTTTTTAPADDSEDDTASAFPSVSGSRSASFSRQAHSTSRASSTAPANGPQMAEWATVVTRKLKKGESEGGYVSGGSGAGSGKGGSAGGENSGWKDPRLTTYDGEKYNVYGEKRKGKKWGAKGF